MSKCKNCLLLEAELRDRHDRWRQLEIRVYNLRSKLREALEDDRRMRDLQPEADAGINRPRET